MTDGGGDLRLNTSTLRDEAYELLRERILNREFPPGYRFDLSLLESQMGISRTPLKEALQRLEAEGLVEVRARRGTFVADADPQEIVDNFEVRCALQVHAVKLGLEKAADSEIERLQELVDAMHDLAERYTFQDALDRYLALDREFHQALVALAHNERLFEAHEQSDVYVHFARLKQDFGAPDLTDTEAEHDQIMEALVRRDVAAAVEAVERHTAQSKARMVKVLNEYD